MMRDGCTRGPASGWLADEQRALIFPLDSYFLRIKLLVYTYRIRTRLLLCNFAFGPACMRGARPFIFCLNDFHLQR